MNLLLDASPVDDRGKDDCVATASSLCGDVDTTSVCGVVADVVGDDDPPDVGVDICGMASISKLRTSSCVARSKGV